MPAAQVPLPLQVGIGSSVAVVQLATPHWVPAPQLRQAPAPSQVPSSPQLVGAEALQSLRTSVPETAGVQCPTVPTPLQFSQQTPSTQNPLWQSPFPVQAMPFAWTATQWPPEQKLPAVQSMLLVQALRQVPAPHMYAPHDVLLPARQVPAPSQVRAEVSVEPEQVSGPQVVPAA